MVNVQKIVSVVVMFVVVKASVKLVALVLVRQHRWYVAPLMGKRHVSLLRLELPQFVQMIIVFQPLLQLHQAVNMQATVHQDRVNKDTVQLVKQKIVKVLSGHVKMMEIAAIALTLVTVLPMVPALVMTMVVHVRIVLIAPVVIVKMACVLPALLPVVRHLLICIVTKLTIHVHLLKISVILIILTVLLVNVF